MWIEKSSQERGALAHALLVTVQPGEAVSLPQNTRLRVQTVSGTAHITHTGRDLLLWRGDTENLEKVSREWGAPVLTALGNRSVTVALETEKPGAGWQWRQQHPETVERSQSPRAV